MSWWSIMCCVPSKCHRSTLGHGTFGCVNSSGTPAERCASTRASRSVAMAAAVVKPCVWPTGPCRYCAVEGSIRTRPRGLSRTLFTFVLGQIELDVLVDSTGGQGEATFDGMTTAANLSRDELFDIGLDAVIAGIKITMGNSTGGC